MELKRLFFLVCLLCAALTAPAQKLSEFRGQIKFGAIKHNVGNVYRHYPLHRVVFQFRNVGKQPLKIYKVEPFCGCVTAKFTEKPVLPGQLGYITLTYNGGGKHDGYFSENIEVYSSSEKDPRIYLNISGTLVEYQPPAEK
jgi:hypothetical protein